MLHLKHKATLISRHSSFVNARLNMRQREYYFDKYHHKHKEHSCLSFNLKKVNQHNIFL